MANTILLAMFTIVFLLLSLSAFADSALDQSIRLMQQEAMPDPAPKREALYLAGAHFFHHKKLSGNQNIACVNCHSPKGFSGDQLPLGLGEGSEGFGINRHQSQGRILPRHTPAIFNLGSGRVSNYMWDASIKKDFRGWWMTPEPLLNGPSPKLSKVATTFDSLLSVQAIFPISNPDEMLGQRSSLNNVEAWNEALKRILHDQALARVLRAAYPNEKELNIGHVGNALAEFQRHYFKSNNTPYDLYLRGQKQYMNARMVRGAKIFYGKANCIFCHQGQHLSTFGTINIGVPQLLKNDLGEASVNPNGLNHYAFRISPLRNVGVTAPYMHTGVFQDLREVINHYNDPVNSFKNFVWNKRYSNYREDIALYTDPSFLRDKAKSIPSVLRPLNLSEDEKEDLHCFLKVGLTDLKYQRRLSNDIEDCAPLAKVR